jgi:hypothetical protein
MVLICYLALRTTPGIGAYCLGIDENLRTGTLRFATLREADQRLRSDDYTFTFSRKAAPLSGCFSAPVSKPVQMPQLYPYVTKS